MTEDEKALVEKFCDDTETKYPETAEELKLILERMKQIGLV